MRARAAKWIEGYAQAVQDASDLLSNIHDNGCSKETVESLGRVQFFLRRELSKLLEEARGREVEALAHGGPSTATNLRPAHAVCNLRKGARAPAR